MKLKCECCGFQAEFASYKGAFEAGWDTEERFSYTSCNLCPGAFVFLQQTWRHQDAHERWEREGRPEKFTTGDMRLEDRPDPGKLKRIEKLVREWEGDPEDPELFYRLQQIVREGKKDG